MTEAVETLAGLRPHFARENESGLRRSPFQPRLTTGFERDDAAPTLGRGPGVRSPARRGRLSTSDPLRAPCSAPRSRVRGEGIPLAVESPYRVA